MMTAAGENRGKSRKPAPESFLPHGSLPGLNPRLHGEISSTVRTEK